MRRAAFVALLAVAGCSKGEPRDHVLVVAWEGEPSSLLGLTRAEIEAKFGSASTCEPWGGQLLDPCKSARDWFYPADYGTRGGKVLLLRFDDTDAAAQSPSAHCVVARYEMTK